MSRPRSGRPSEARDAPNEAARMLAASGQRATRNRIAVVEVLAAAGRPLTAEQILGRRTGLALSSVYRSLAVLEAAGVVRRVVTDADLARYELAEDLTRHHHHLVCASCGSVEDFAASGRLERRVQEALADAAARSGFAPQAHEIDLIGLCRSCR